MLENLNMRKDQKFAKVPWMNKRQKSVDFSKEITRICAYYFIYVQDLRQNDQNDKTAMLKSILVLSCLKIMEDNRHW